MVFNHRNCYLKINSEMEYKLIEIGKINELIVSRENNSGYYLIDNISDEEAFMPASFGPEDVIIDKRINAFVYLDTSNSLIATTIIPSAVIGEFALMKVVDSKEMGAFFDWGISKDLFVPDTEQRESVSLGESHVLRVCLDERTEKIYGSK